MRHFKAIGLLLMLCVLSSCAAPDLPDVFWPLPPNPPKIKFVRSITGSGDIAGLNAKDILLGAKPQSAMFVKPNGIHVDRRGQVYVTDTGKGSVDIFDLKEKKSYSIKASGRALFVKPVGVTTDAEGRIYVSDSSMDAVMVFTPDRRFIKSIGTGGTLKQPVGLAVDNERKRLYVVDTHKHQVMLFDLETGEFIRAIGKRGRGDGSFNYPQRIALDRAGNLHVVDTMNGRVQILDSEGRFLRKFGKLGDGPGNFARPKGIALDSEGHIYVVDAAFNNVQIFNDEGQILLAFGQYGEGRGDMVLPAGLAIDGEDQIYVVDQWGGRVNIYEFMGEKYKAREGKKEQVKK